MTQISKPEAKTDARLLLLAPSDNVFVLRAAVDAGEMVRVEGSSVHFAKRLGLGQKVARRPIGTGEKVIKYGAPIGSASQVIAVGQHVHLHNLQSDYTATYSLTEARQAHDRETEGSK